MARYRDGTRADSVAAERPTRREGSPGAPREGGAAQVPFQAVLENIVDGFIALDGDDRCIYVNQAAAAFLNTTVDRLLGRPIWEAFPAPRYPQLHREIAQAAEQRVFVKFDEYCQRCGRWFAWRCYPTDSGLAIFLEEATERKRTEEALRESEERLRLALEGGRMGRWEWDLQTDAVFWCPRVYELLGLDPSVPAERGTFFERVHPEDRAAVNTHLAQTLQKQKNLEVEFRVLRQPEDPQGAVAWLASHAKVICDEHGQTQRVIGVMYDITQRKQMEDRLRRLNDQLAEEVEAQTERLRSTAHRLQDEAVGRVVAESELRKQSQMLEGFFEHTITPLAFLGRDFHFVRVNQAFAQAAGRDCDSLAGEDYFALYPHEDRTLFEQVVRTRQPYFAPAKPLWDPHHPRHPVSYWDWQLTPLLDRSGQVQSLVLNCEDVTQQQKAYSELEHRAHQLQKLALELSETEDRERQHLAEILHDDLQQTLAAAKFHLGLMRRQLGAQSSLQVEVADIEHMLQDAIGKSRSLSHELHPAVLHQGDFAETLQWLAEEMQAQHGLTVHVQAPDAIAVASGAIRAFLYKATQELLFNVVKHARVGEAVVRIRRRGRYLCLAIRDRGRGFDVQDLRQTNGFGLLGLRERAELLGGRMTIHSAPGRGSTFRIVIPARAEESQDPEDKKVRTQDGRKLSPSNPLNFSPACPHGDQRLRVLLAAIRHEPPDPE